VQWQNSSGANVNFFGPGYGYEYTGQNIQVAGCYLGATLSGSVSNFALNMIALEFEDTGWFMSQPFANQPT
jgi:hypothetical protein